MAENGQFFSYNYDDTPKAERPHCVVYHRVDNAARVIYRSVDKTNAEKAARELNANSDNPVALDHYLCGLLVSVEPTQRCARVSAERIAKDVSGRLGMPAQYEEPLRKVA